MLLQAQLWAAQRRLAAQLAFSPAFSSPWYQKLPCNTPLQTTLTCLEKSLDRWMLSPLVAFHRVLWDDRQIWEVQWEAGQGWMFP